MEYSVNHKIRINGKTKQISRPHSDTVEYYLSSVISKRAVRVITTVEFETNNKMNAVISNAMQKANLLTTNARKLAILSTNRFRTLQCGTIYEDDITLLPQVSEMYHGIWRDPAKDSKKQIWSQKKNKQIRDGPPMDSDLIILSTAAKMAESQDVELLTLDNDFIIFKDEIRDRFNVSVMDAGLIPR